jgi:hypothetical protein
MTTYTYENEGILDIKIEKAEAYHHTQYRQNEKQKCVLILFKELHAFLLYDLDLLFHIIVSFFVL